MKKLIYILVMFVIFTGINYAQNLDSGLVAWYPLNGTPNDSSGFGQHGTIYGSVTFGLDRFGNNNSCYVGNGSTFIKVNNFGYFPIGNSSRSTCLWLKCVLPHPGGFRAPFCYGAGTFGTRWGYHRDPTTMGLEWVNGSVTINNVPDSNWHFVVFTYPINGSGSSAVKMYLDGVLQNTTVWNPVTSFNTGTEGCFIGAIAINYGYSWVGKLDDIRVYNRELSQTEVTALYTGFPTTDTTTTWRMQIQSQIGGVYDNGNYAGTADSATEGFDSQYDLPEPPVSPGNYVSTYFYHPEWGVITGTDFARDIKKNTNISDTIKRWFFYVKTNVVNDTIKLTFVSDRIPTALGKYLTDLSTGQRINLKTTPQYKYYNTLTTSRQFELIIGDSTVPSVVLLYPNGSNIFRSGTIRNINWTASDGTGVDSIFIYKSTNSGTNYSLIKGVGYSQTTSWQIPEEYLNNNYSIKITARDSLGNTNTTKSLNTFTVVGDSLASTANAGWNMISLPFVPNDSMSVKIFRDDFGSNPYYIWGYGYTTGYFTAPYLLPGKGYWLGSLSSTIWDLRGTAIESDSTIQDLELGFNLIGNKYVREISKNTLEFIKSGIQYKFSSAVTNGLISGTIYRYNGTGYSASDTLDLFKGYWLGVLQTGVKMVQKPLPSVIVPLNPALTDPTPDNWELSLNAFTIIQSDEISKIGVKPDATQGYDVQYDSPRPPRAPGNNYLELYFEHSGGNWPSFLGNKYASDFTSPANPGWTFKIDCSQINTDVNITWSRYYLSLLGGGVSLMLTDNINNQTVNMKTDSIYTFNYNGIRTFTLNSIITNMGITSELPTEYGLNQNYPNPFNPITTIKYQVPEQTFVIIKIYDITGKEVATLVNEARNAGYYEISFNASNLSSGIYFYKMISGEFVTIKKLVVLK